MRNTIMAIILVAALGCASSTITIPLKNGAVVKLDQDLGGRGCIAITTNGAGGVDAIVQQDGSSDWGGLRALPAIARTVITAVFGSRDPQGGEGFSAPSPIAGCQGLFEGDDPDGE